MMAYQHKSFSSREEHVRDFAVHPARRSGIEKSKMRSLGVALCTSLMAIPAASQLRSESAVAYATKGSADTRMATQRLSSRVFSYLAEISQTGPSIYLRRYLSALADDSLNLAFGLMLIPQEAHGNFDVGQTKSRGCMTTALWFIDSGLRRIGNLTKSGCTIDNKTHAIGGQQGYRVG